MKKILCIGMSNILGGIESVVLSYLPFLPKDDFHMDFLSFFPTMIEEENIVRNGSTVYHLTARGVDAKKHYQEVKEFFKKYGKEYDALWYHCSALSSGHIIKEARKSGIPFIIVHGHASKLEVPSKLKELVHTLLHKYNQKRLLKSCQWLIGCSEKSREFFYGNFPSEVIENGVDLGKFYFDLEKRAKIRAEYGIEEDALVLGIASRFVPIKNLSFVLSVFSDVAKDNSKARLMMVGEGELKEALLKEAKDLGISHQVIWTGFQKDLNDYYSAMDVYLLASFGEGFPVSVIEAQACGLRGVISNRITPEVIKTDLFIQASIDEGTKPWVEALAKFEYDYDRRIYPSILEEKGVTSQKIATDFFERLKEKLGS